MQQTKCRHAVPGGGKIVHPQPHQAATHADRGKDCSFPARNPTTRRRDDGALFASAYNLRVGGVRVGCLLKQGGRLYLRLRIGAVLLAAGEGRRMGGVAKPLIRLQGVPLAPLRQPGMRDRGRHCRTKARRRVRGRYVLLLLRRLPDDVSPGPREVCRDPSRHRRDDLSLRSKSGVRPGSSSP